MTPTIPVSTADLWPLLINSVRYALGRSSYAPAEVSDIVLSYARALEPWQRGLLVKEIEGEIQRGRYRDSLGKPLPFPSEDVWRDLAAKLRAMEAT